jgi:predicted nucleic acid-binding protein
VNLVVVDASALAEYLLRTDRGERMAPVVEAPHHDLHAPSLCDVELVAVLRRALRLGELGLERARAALRDHLDLPLVRHGHRRSLARALELRENFSAYDAVYVALAERLDAGLLTADRALARALGDHTDVPALGQGSP